MKEQKFMAVVRNGRWGALTFDEVDRLLGQGWRVTSVSPVRSEEGVTIAYLVLEREVPLPGDGPYRSKP